MSNKRERLIVIHNGAVSIRVGLENSPPLKGIETIDALFHLRVFGFGCAIAMLDFPVVFDADAQDALVEIVANFTLVVTSEFPSQECRNILRFNGVYQGFDLVLINRFEIFLAFEDNVGVAYSTCMALQ